MNDEEEDDEEEVSSSDQDTLSSSLINKNDSNSEDEELNNTEPSTTNNKKDENNAAQANTITANTASNTNVETVVNELNNNNNNNKNILTENRINKKPSNNGLETNVTNGNTAKSHNNNNNINNGDSIEKTINEPQLNISLLEMERKAVKINREEDCRVTFSGRGLQEYYEKNDNSVVLEEIMRCFKSRTENHRIDKIKRCRIYYDEESKQYALLIVARNKVDANKLKGKWPTNAFGSGITRIRNKDVWTICLDLKEELSDEIVKELKQLGIVNPTRHSSFATNKPSLLIKANVNSMEMFLKLFRTGIWLNGKHIDIFPWIYPPRLCNTCGKYGHNDYDTACKTPTGGIKCLKCGAAHSTTGCQIKNSSELLCYFCHQDGENDNHAAFSGFECYRFKLEQVKHNRYVIELLQDAGLINHEFEALKQHVQSAARNKKLIKPTRIGNNNANEIKLDQNTLNQLEKFIVNRFNTGIMPKMREENENLRKTVNKQIDTLTSKLKTVSNRIEAVVDTVNAHGEYIVKLVDNNVVENILEIRKDQLAQFAESKRTNELLAKLLNGNNNSATSGMSSNRLTLQPQTPATLRNTNTNNAQMNKKRPNTEYENNNTQIGSGNI